MCGSSMNNMKYFEKEYVLNIPIDTPIKMADILIVGESMRMD